jgi:CheY-like chemotaxis protein
MPRMNGIEVIRTLRANRHLHSTMPVIAITAYVLRANRDAIYAAGADAILAKPLAGLDTFGLAIASALARAGGGGVTVAPDAGVGEGFDRRTFDHLIAIAGPEAAQELLERLCADLDKCAQGLAAGLSRADLAAVRAETHVLIALAGAVGDARLQCLAQTLNTGAHRHDGAALDRYGDEALTQLDALIRFVAQERAGRGEAA